MENGKEYFYIPKVTHQKGGGAKGINYGFLCVLPKRVFYVPKRVLNLERLGALTDIYKVDDRNQKQINGIQFENIVPDAVTAGADGQKLLEIIAEVAKQVPGSQEIALREISEIKIGFFDQFSFVYKNERFKFAVGGKKVREQLSVYLKDRIGLAF